MLKVVSSKNMSYCRHVMVKTRVFIGCLSRTVIGHPSLILPAWKLYGYTRSRRSRGIVRFLPSRRYIEFRLYTQYGYEDIEKTQLKEDIYQYLIWVKTQQKSK